MTSATLNGTVDPNGRATAWYFEYGTSTSYGSKTADEERRLGNEHGERLGPVSGLTRGRLYHYRLVATSDAGTSRGADQTFSTVGAPTVVDRGRELDRARRRRGSTAPSRRTDRPRAGTSSTARLRATAPRRAVRSAGSGTSSARASPSSLTRPDGQRPRTTTAWSRRTPSGTTSAATRPSRTALSPAVRTGAAQAVGTTTATLTGSRRPEGPRDDWCFEYGTTNALRVEDVATKRRLGLRRRGASARRSRASRPARPTTTGSSRRATRERAAAPTSRSRPSA